MKNNKNIKMLEAMIPQYPQYVTASEIARLSGLGLKRVCNWLKNIPAKDLVCEDDGKFSRCDDWIRRD